ncbi:acetyl-CoA carboxylase biotin carboxyl carrier protein subunit, partial [Nocardia araoensis]|uniref:acetyl-CoA carboxylase biotin carboxyl carrier protein subunit n=1 Tax=Nocardia araoensis TaxID=228600 RepID=UPI000585305E
RRWPAAPRDPWEVPSGWRIGADAPTPIRLAGGERVEHVYLSGTPGDGTVRVDDGESRSLTASFTASGDRGAGVLTLTLDGLRRTYRVAEHDGLLWVAGPSGIATLREVAEVNVRGGDEHVGDAEIRSPMPGSVIAVPVAAGATVAAGDPVVIVEAMKMEHSLTAPVAGTVELLVEPGAQVRLDQVLARVVAQAATNHTEKEGIPA